MQNNTISMQQGDEIEIDILQVAAELKPEYRTEPVHFVSSSCVYSMKISFREGSNTRISSARSDRTSSFVRG